MPNSSAEGRRRNEERHYDTLKSFFTGLGFTDLGKGKFEKWIFQSKKKRIAEYFIRVDFYYAESCNHVYKRFSVSVNGKKSNVTGLKKYLAILEASQTREVV